MIAAAATVNESAERTPLFDELEEILGAFAALGKPAQNAITVVVASLMRDPESTDAERDLATALFVVASARIKLNTVGGHDQDPPAFGDGLRARIEKMRLARAIKPAERENASAEGPDVEPNTEKEPDEPDLTP